jgi:hypothetical protein
MTVLEQIEYINSNLAEGKTITKICESIGIGRTTIRDRFIKSGFIYSKENNSYSTSNDKNITKVINENNITHDSRPKPINNNKNELQSIKEFNNIKNDLTELINNKDELLEMLKDYKNHTNVIDIPMLDINTLPGEMQKNILTKSIKVYKPIYDLFDKLCNQYNSIKKQDLVSLALYEFYLKYKK